MGERFDEAAIAAVLEEMIDLLAEYEMVQWARALTADRSRVLAGDDRAVPIIRYRLDAKHGLHEVRIGLGDRALNARLNALRERLDMLTETKQEPDQEERERADEPPRYGERIEEDVDDERAPDQRELARDHARGTLLRDGEGRWFRSTWSLLDYDEHVRFRLVVRVWKPTTLVSIEEYRSLRRSCIGWWITLAAIPFVPVVAGLAGATGDAFLWVLLVCGIAMPASAIVVGWFERRRSAVTAVFSERTRTLIYPLSRGARPRRSTQDDPAEDR